MNYFLILLVIGIAGFAYYQHNQDQLQVADLQQQITDMQTKAKSVSSGNDSKTAAPSPRPAALTISPAIKVVAPSTQSSAIDAATQAATAAAASNSNNLGTINTLDGRTFQNCKVLKVESDGVTFSHDDGITKVLFPFLPPTIQRQFGYDPQKAVAQTDAQVRYDEQQAAATNTSPAPANR